MALSVSPRDAAESATTPATGQASQASLVTRARNKAVYTVQHKVVLGVEPVWRHVANARASRDYRRRVQAAGKGLSPESQRVLDDLNRQGCSRSTLEALTGDATLLGRLQATARAYETQRVDEIATQLDALQRVDDLGDGNSKPFLVQFLDAHRPVI